MSKKKNEKLEKDITNEMNENLPVNPTGEEITFQSVNPEANELEKENTEKEQEPGANEPEVNSANNPDENQDNTGADDTQSDENTDNKDNSDSQNEPEVKKVTLLVEVNFTDKYTGEKYKAGKEYPFEPKRAKELLADKRGLVSEVK